MFNGKSVVGFVYARNGSEWTLKKIMMDARVRERIWAYMASGLHTVLPGVPAERRPWVHQRILSEALAKANLDGGLVRENYGDYHLLRGSYTVEIEAEEGPNRPRT